MRYREATPILNREATSNTTAIKSVKNFLVRKLEEAKGNPKSNLRKYREDFTAAF
jgi:hypothetical protein